MAKSKAEKSFQEKLKQFFKVGVSRGLTVPTQDVDFILEPEVLADLGNEAELSTRLKAMSELTPTVKTRRLQDPAVELLWVKVQDLAKGCDVEARHETWKFLEAVIRGQFDQIDSLRLQFFKLVKGQFGDSKKPANYVKQPPSAIDADLDHRLRILDALTKNGRDVLPFEYEIGPLVQKLWPLILANYSKEIVQTYLRIVINLLKFNSTFLDSDVVCSFIAAFSRICAIGKTEEIELCLNSLDAIICYKNIPKEGLLTFICLLCRVVNLEQHCTEAWRISRNLLGTHQGHSALYSLCQILQAPDFKGDAALIRGAVFFVGMGLWGSQRVKALDGYSAMTILPTFHNAADCRHQLVLYEVILQTERLVTKHAHRLRAPGCDAVVALTERVVFLSTDFVDAKLKPEILVHVHNIITYFENLSANDKYLGSKHRLYDLIDQCCGERPIESVIGLITYRINDIYTTKPGWIGVVADLMAKFYKSDKRSEVRKQAVQSLLQIYKSNKQIHEEEILRKLILPSMSALDEEADESVKLEAIKAITSICIECSSKKSVELLDILEKVIMKPIDHKDDQHSTARFEDVHQAVLGVIAIFCARLCQHPASITIRAYHILVKHIEVSYNHLSIFGQLGQTRKAIFQLFMQLRANEKLHLGVERGRGLAVHYSPYLICRSHILKDQPPANPGAKLGKNVVFISLTKACVMVIKSLCQERDYNVLKLVLDEVPLVLQNKAIFSLYGSDIKAFITPLIELTSQKSSYPEILFNLPEADQATGKRYSKGEFQNKVYTVLAAIAPYTEYLENSKSAFSLTKVAKDIVMAFLSGLSYKECSRTCIVALTACSLEMKKTMHNMIEKVLLDFSKITATKHVATPMLEFLSTLIRLPEIFCSFTDRHYLSVFAIALPFTNPYKFDAYTVSLAHHVIIMWFLKCRLAFRQNFVTFIIQGLNSFVFKSINDDGGLRRGSNAAMIAAVKPRTKSGGSDMMSRLRSNSLSENSPEKAKVRHATAAIAASGVMQPLSTYSDHDKLDKMMNFHGELSETCVDILATYMFANVAVKPKRMPTAEFLLKNGQKLSWVIGTKIVTVTTSTCDQTTNRGALCDRCYLVCTQGKSETSGVRHKSSEVIGNNPAEQASGESDVTRRRHMSDAPIGSPIKGPPVGLLARRDSGEKVQELSQPPKGQDMSQLEALLDMQENEKKVSELCSCWCNGWAEIHVRRPSGDVSWMMRTQNASLTSESHAEFPLTDLTSLFHPDKEQPSQGLLGANETTSIFARGRTASDSSNSAPSSPVKEIKRPEFGELSPSHDSTKSPLSKTLSSPDSGNKGSDPNSNKQSYDPIPEVEDEEERQHDSLRRRTSLQTSHSSLASGAEESVADVPPGYALATPPRTPHLPPNLLNKTPRNRVEALQAGSYGSSGDMRNRAHTISGPSPRRSGDKPFFNPSSSGGFPSRSSEPSSGTSSKMDRVTGISPQFVFLALYNSKCLDAGQEKPMLINLSNKSIESSLKSLDLIHPHETHKIGVLYVGPGQSDNETGILANQFGSLRYTNFLHGLGSLICLKDVDPKVTFLGGLNHEEGDGDFAYMWEDDVMQVIYHVATLMPNHPEKDPNFNKKKRHIGNNFVAIVYNNAGDNQVYKIGTVRGQFIYACVVITPLEQGSNRVEIQCRPELDEPLEHIKDAKIVSDRNLAVLVRQVALHCNLAAQIQRSVSTGREPYASNWLERLRAIKRIRDKVTNEAESCQDSKAADSHKPNNAAAYDFTKSVLRKN